MLTHHRRRRGVGVGVGGGAAPVVLRGSNEDGGGEGDDGNAAVADAERLLAKARAIRAGLGAAGAVDASSGPVAGAAGATTAKQSEFSLPLTVGQPTRNGFRLYIDVGREPGTWMDPRWGASGRRIECTVDVSFAGPTTTDEEGDDAATVSLASDDIAAGLIKTVTTKSSSLSPVYELQSAPYVRLRGGWDKMAITDGGYCVESSRGASSSTLRFCLSVDGITDGDVSIPKGKLYFALPYFGTKTEGGDSSTAIMALSSKEGTVTVKQMGWNTGWRREESRILGVFRAVPLETAQKRDKF